ncbi:MAG TPA: sugar phosphate isomerase/epimerase family protein [Pirellulales bacterium]|nr:sugar phosphate isomerase/epimerase family protein [Pirellulales bacterium]
MIRSSVTISLVHEARGGPFVFWDDLPGACRQARELGFDAIEIFPPGPEAVDRSQVRTLLADHGLALAAVGSGAGWVKNRLHLCLPDAARRTKARVFIRSIIDAAGALGAPAIIGSMQGRSGDGVDQATAGGYLAEALEDLGEHARQYAVPLVFEPLNRYETNMVNTIAAGVRLLERLSTRNVALLADLFHMNIEEVDLPAAIREGGGHIGHVHFVDSNRRPAGLGHIDYSPIVAALDEIGYAGYASAEALPHPDSNAAARQTMVAFKKHFHGSDSTSRGRE